MACLGYLRFIKSKYAIYDDSSILYIMKQFVARESFKHKFAKELLFEWLNTGGFDDYQCDKTAMEYPLSYRANTVTKVADIATFNKDSIHAIFEIYHTHRIERKKLDTLTAKWPNLIIYEICADTIMNLTDRPSSILDLCEIMHGNIRSKKTKQRKKCKTHIFKDEYEERADSRYDSLRV